MIDVVQERGNRRYFLFGLFFFLINQTVRTDCTAVRSLEILDILNVTWGLN